MPFNNHFEEGYNMHSMTYFQQYKQCSALAGIGTRAIDSPTDIPLAESGWKLIEEEWQRELVPAWEKYKLNPSRENFVEVADGIVDSVVVLLDFAHKLGVPFDECWNAIQQNNLSKKWPDGTFHLDENKKWIKPPGFKKVELWEVIEAVAARQCFNEKKFGAENWKEQDLANNAWSGHVKAITPNTESALFTRTQVDSSEQS